MEEQESFGTSIAESLDQGWDVVRRQLHDLGAELGDVLRNLTRGGLMIGGGGALALVGASAMGLVALTQPTPDRARAGYAVGLAALGVGAALLGLGAVSLPQAPLRGLQAQMVEGLSRSLPH